MKSASKTYGMKQFLFLMAALGALAFVAYPTFTNAPTYNRIPLPVLALWPSATVMFVGDMLFDRTVRATMEAKGEDFVFSCIADVLRGADLVVGNLEGPITENSSVSLGSTIGSPENFTFTFPTSTALLLARHNIRVVNLGNNHIQNFGWEGVSSTLRYLRAAGVGYFGDPLLKSVAREEIKGVRLAFINYNEFAPEGSRKNASTTLEEIRSARRDAYLPVVYAHWGDEYAESAPSRVRELAYAFVDAGASIVIGSHPHVVQESELYLPAHSAQSGRGTYIYYSLGNFLFDHYWNPAVRHGLLLKVVFTASGVERLERIPIDNRTDRRPCAE